MSALHDALQAFVGRPLQPPVTAADPVNLPFIRRWLEAMGETNPIYLDAGAARAHGRPGPVAPAAMLMVWTMKGYRETLREGREPGQGLFACLAAAGFASTPAVHCRQRYLRELHPGDVLSAATVVEVISPEKTTALGPAHFVTLATDYRDAGGALVGTQQLQVCAFRKPPVAAASSGGAGRGVVDEGDGEPLPALAIPLDRLAVIACSVACGDFRAGHFDPDAARAIGLPDIIIDIATALGFTQRYVGDWAGPGARVLGIDLRLGVPTCAGDTLRFSGRAGAVGSDGVRRVRVAADTARGRPISAVVELAAG